MTCSKESSNHFSITDLQFFFFNLAIWWNHDVWSEFFIRYFLPKGVWYAISFHLKSFLIWEQHKNPDGRQQTKDAWALGHSSFKVFKCGWCFLCWRCGEGDALTLSKPCLCVTSHQQGRLDGVLWTGRCWMDLSFSLPVKAKPAEHTCGPGGSRSGMTQIKSVI